MRRPPRTPPELLFVTAALSQYAGAAVAVLLFAFVAPAGVVWLRVLVAGLVLAAVRRPRVRTWTPRTMLLIAAFGGALAAMNLTFYLAIELLPLGTAVAIEFIGPVAVAALGSRSRHQWLALASCAAGVLLLANVQLEASPEGVAFALAAAVFWAAYIVLGHRVAHAALGLPALGAAMLAGSLVIAPVAAPAALPAFASLWLLAACIGVGLFSSVVPYGLEQKAMALLPRERFALLLALLPATATVVGLVLLGQVPELEELAGIALVIVAVAVSRGGAAPAPRPAEGELPR